MAAVPALARTECPALLPLIGADGHGIPPSERTRLERSLETLFPDMLVHGTHSALLGMTTSLTKAGGQVHQYFHRVNQVLAFERMMRGFMEMTAAMSPFPVDTNLTHYWASMFMPQTARSASPWAFPAPQPKPMTGMDFFANAFAQPTAKPAPALPFFANIFPQKTQPAPRPAMPLPFFPNAFQPQQAAPARTSVWPDYSTLMVVPMAMIMAAPTMDQMLGRAQ